MVEINPNEVQKYWIELNKNIFVPENIKRLIQLLIINIWRFIKIHVYQIPTFAWYW
jgi:hypothetical protein